MQKKNLLTLLDLEKDTFIKILEDSHEFKKGNKFSTVLQNRNIGLIFEKPSTRTRVSSEVAIRHLGGNPIYLNSGDLQINRGESIDDTAAVLGRYLDALIYRTKKHSRLEAFSRASGIPVVNALSDIAHPLQILADFMTIQENGLDLDQARVCFLGDGQNNVCRSLMTGFSFFSGHMTVVSPVQYQPDPDFLGLVTAKNKNITVSDNVLAAVADADVLYTDVWVSMGNEDESEVRKRILQPYQMNLDIVRATGKSPVILHCLPANKGEEITEDVFELGSSHIIDQAENRLHTMKSVLKYIFSEA